MPNVCTKYNNNNNLENLVWHNFLSFNFIIEEIFNNQIFIMKNCTKSSALQVTQWKTDMTFRLNNFKFKIKIHLYFKGKSSDQILFNPLFCFNVLSGWIKYLRLLLNLWNQLKVFTELLVLYPLLIYRS